MALPWNLTFALIRNTPCTSASFSVLFFRTLFFSLFSTIGLETKSSCFQSIYISNSRIFIFLSMWCEKFESDNSELRKNTLITDGLMTVVGRFIQIILGCNDPI
ncbi:uncharacterized protein EV154DRAFT_551797 [Mucor mucedo]|uniref:uncharacterized protein n=1 Tax=Mucor mucedo TaxID=29922 RepID=UPI00221EDFCF|nr:uncharacterized protein EV154DRAFT_551797 [Mucor mucedo]KAI7891135.1 hypothetical protein EV154DRAFT_551797 [Mucor mucedo]